VTSPRSDLRLHPWNRGFEWVDRTGPYIELDPAEVAHFDELGYVIVADLLDPASLVGVRDEIDRFEAAMEEVLRRSATGRVSIAEADAITFTTHLVARSPLLRSLSAHPRLRGICADLVGPDVDLYWDQAVYKKPQKPRRFPWHQDNGYTYVEPQQYLTCWLALTDATVTSGCPWVAPRLHRLGTLRHEFVDPLGYECFSDAPDSVAAEVPAGGAVVFSSLTPHLTGPNTTAEVRKAYILQYAPTGAEALRGDPDAGAPTLRERCDAPDRQFAILRGGLPVPV
jgi:phytanoyl-CoA hydroxylase